MLNILRCLFDLSEPRDAWATLYDRIIEEARNPAWYVAGEVEDSKNGRFEMLSLVMALVAIRLEAEGDAGEKAQLMLAELFVDDLDGQMREEGTGDSGVGKQMGAIMSGLGGRISAYREGLLSDKELALALTRNLYRGIEPTAAALAWAMNQTRHLHLGLADQSLKNLEQGGWPA